MKNDKNTHPKELMTGIYWGRLDGKTGKSKIKKQGD